MAVKKYKPREVEAIKWTGDNWEEIKKWAFIPNGSLLPGTYQNMTINVYDRYRRNKPCRVGDWIVKYVEGWFDVMTEAEFTLAFEEMETRVEIPTFNPYFYKNCSTLLSRDNYSEEEIAAIDRFDDLCKQMLKNDTIDAVAMAMKMKFSETKTPFEIAAEPLIKYMAENHHPHCTCIVDSTHAEVLEGIKVHKTEEFITD